MSAPPTDVVDRLQRLAAGAPGAGVDPDALWTRGRRRQRVRTGGVAAALVLVGLAGATTTPLLVERVQQVEPARTDKRTPTRAWWGWASSPARSSRGGSSYGSGGDVATPEGFSEFVLGRQPALLRTAYLLTGHAQDAEDLVQVALVKVVPQWRRIRDNPEPYVRQVLVNENISRWRRRRWREHTIDELPEVLAQDPDHAELVAVRDALAALAPRQRAVLVLRYYEGLSEAEIASTLGIAPGTVKSQARYGLARLRKALPAEEGAEALGVRR